MEQHVPFRDMELTEREGEPPTEYLVRVFNNLPLALAGSPQRAMCLVATFRDIPRRQFWDDERLQYQHHTARYMDQTAEQWYVDIDQACATVGYSLETVQSTLNTWLTARLSNSLEERQQAAVSMCDFLKPIYATLRAMGYSRNDLWT